MLNGSSKILRLASWPPGVHLLNFPQPAEHQNQRLVCVHFPSPPDFVLDLRRQAVSPDNGRAAGQVEDVENDRIVGKKFMRLCYLVASVFCVMSALQMLIIAALLRPSAADLVPGFVCILMSLMALFVLSLLEKLRQILWTSLLLSSLFVEFVSVGLIMVLVQRTLLLVGIALPTAGVLLVVGYVLGAWLPKVVLPGERFMLVLILIFALISVFLLTMHIFTNKWNYATAYFCVLLAVLIPVTAYHAQLVHNRRYRLPFHEFVFTATYIHLHFLLFFSATFYCIWFLNI